ncbi:type I-E CRISPR-associated protein Cse1/CasA [Streptomyces sp. DT195]|uniref:type I-E CRISPR-associated protein Cse1/CasA n=1 Tax=Streptomyces sp. DT195 TaxID=3393419 RepID=UPI003CF761AA
MAPTFSLVTEPWINVWDLNTGESRDVGMGEALTRAHRLRLTTHHPENVAALRTLAAAFDAACGPSTTAEWDAAWKAPTLDTAALDAYWERWADRLDLFHPEHPAFQCGQLTEYNRGPEALHPGTLAGEAGPWFNHELYKPLPPWAPSRAAQLLLHLLTYDVAGIKRAAPGDPAGRGSKVYGSSIGPVAASTHLHLDLMGGTLKDVLLLNLPPQPRAAGDAPVWERPTPPAPMRERAATGRLDLLTWPNRRIRLHPQDDGTVDAVAHHDGDRLPNTWGPTHALDPMTIWLNGDDGSSPMRLFNAQGWPEPWQAAQALAAPPTGLKVTSAAITHTIAAAERGTLDPDQSVNASVGSVAHSNRHRSTISDIAVSTAPMGTVGQWADPEARTSLAAMVRYAGLINSRLLKHAVRVSRLPADRIRGRLTLMNLEGPWREAVHTSATDMSAARARWDQAVHEDAETNIGSLPLTPLTEAELLTVYRTDPTPKKDKPQRRRATAPAPAAPAAPRAKRGPRAERYEVFGGQYTLAELSRHPDCAVSYPTLAKRVKDEDWDVTTAATTPARGVRATPGAGTPRPAGDSDGS